MQAEPRLDGWITFEAEGLDGSTVEAPVLAIAKGAGEESFLVVWPRETSLRAVVGTRAADGGEEEAQSPVEGASAGEADGGVGPGLERLVWVRQSGLTFSRKAEAYVQAGKRFDWGDGDCDGMGACDFVVPGRETATDGGEQTSTLHIVCKEASGTSSCSGADIIDPDSSTDEELVDDVIPGARLVSSSGVIPGAGVVSAAVVVGTKTVRSVLPGPNGALPGFRVTGVSLIDYSAGDVPRIADELRIIVASGAPPPPVPVIAVTPFRNKYRPHGLMVRTPQKRWLPANFYFRTAPGVSLAGRTGMVPERSLFSLHLVEGPALGWRLAVTVHAADPCDGHLACVATGRPDGGVAVLRAVADGGVEFGTFPGDAGGVRHLPGSFDLSGEFGFCDYGVNPLYQANSHQGENVLYDAVLRKKQPGDLVLLTLAEGASPNETEEPLPSIHGQARGCHVYGEVTDAGTVTGRVRFIDVVDSQVEPADGGEIHLSWMAVPEENPSRAEESLPLTKRVLTMGTPTLQWTQHISKAPDGGFRIDFQVATEPGEELVEPSGFKTTPRIRSSGPRYTGHVTLL